ncbi:peroxisome biogenesis protein 16 [Magnolia sinica]|uniref:peroxisome biogenesis protein 16 n=1 Tax=Magnolia sinica TaxID=86752 RepID=UPI0026581F7E|nr:peroxisome biogenesis protein 16 [Magnolia sinica]
MEAYKKWVRKNREYVHSMESLANGMTWLLPERFSASEIGPEAVTAILGVITAVNQHIIDTAPTRKQTSFVEPSFPWSLCISTLKDLETLVEVVAQHFYGDDKKWNFIAVTEATKALVRLALFRDGGYKMLLHGGEVANVEKGTNALESHHGMGNFAMPGGYHGPNGHFHEFRGHDPRNLEGRALSALSRFGENAKMVSNPTWLNRVQHHNDQLIGPPALAIEKPTLSSIWSEKGLSGGLFVMGEVLFIMRPLIYVLFIRKYGVRSWIPWLLSLTVDVTGMGILSHVTSMGGNSSKNSIPLSASEKDEVKRRKLLWALYLMRDPFFSNYSRHRLEHVEKLLGPVPLVGFLTAKLVELLIGAQTRYTYMSGS